MKSLHKWTGTKSLETCLLSSIAHDTDVFRTLSYGPSADALQIISGPCDTHNAILSRSRDEFILGVTSSYQSQIWLSENVSQALMIGKNFDLDA